MKIRWAFSPTRLPGVLTTPPPHARAGGEIAMLTIPNSEKARK